VDGWTGGREERPPVPCLPVKRENDSYNAKTNMRFGLQWNMAVRRFRRVRRAKARRTRRPAHRFGELTGKPVAAGETGQPGSHDRPLRREVRPHGGAQPSRGHWREAFGWISDLDGISVLDRDASRSFGAEMRSRIERGFGFGREGTPRDEVGDCRDPDWSDIVTSEQTPRGRDHGQASSGFCASCRCQASGKNGLGVVEYGDDRL
jgi:hypothetical protein